MTISSILQLPENTITVPLKYTIQIIQLLTFRLKSTPVYDTGVLQPQQHHISYLYLEIGIFVKKIGEVIMQDSIKNQGH